MNREVRSISGMSQVHYARASASSTIILNAGDGLVPSCFQYVKTLHAETNLLIVNTRFQHQGRVPFESYAMAEHNVDHDHFAGAVRSSLVRRIDLLGGVRIWTLDRVSFQLRVRETKRPWRGYTKWHLCKLFERR